MTTRSRSSAPNTPKAALRRDLRLAKELTPRVAEQFHVERRRIAKHPATAADQLNVVEWEAVLADIQVRVGRAVFEPEYVKLTGKPIPTDTRAKQELVALIARLIRDGREAETIAAYIEEAAAGIVTTTRKRIATILRRVSRPSDTRKLSRALRRLYMTDFVKKRANRIALDQVLRATAVYEHGAAMLAQETTGREYIQVWRNQGDDRVRATHSNVSPVSLGEMFKVGGSLLRFPRDPAGPAHETYGCRCWTERRRL